MPVQVDVPSRMIRFGHGKTRVTVAWLAGAALACALIGTCLALLRSDILPFRDAWPSTHGTPTPVSQLAPPQAASQPAGSPSFAAQPTTVGGAPVIGLPGLPAATGPLAPATGSGPLGAALPGTSSSPATTQTTTGNGSVGPQGTTLTTFPATAPPAIPAIPAAPVPGPTTPDVAAAGTDTPVQTSAASRPGPSGRTSDADATGADDDPPGDTTPATGDTPASPVDGETPAGPANAAPTTDPTPSAPADAAPPAESAPVSATPPADATSQPADPGPAETPPAND